MNNFTSEMPFWEILLPEINLELAKLVKEKTSPEIYYNQFYEILKDKYKNYDRIYTDGSKDDDAVSSASVPLNKNVKEQSQRIPSAASIFTAEANAIDMALDAINKTNNINCLILSDSLSCLMALKSSDTKNPIILKLKLRIHRILSRGINISLIWIPSHVGIEGNEMADELAKFSLKDEDIKRKRMFLIPIHIVTK